MIKITNTTLVQYIPKTPQDYSPTPKREYDSDEDDEAAKAAEVNLDEEREEREERERDYKEIMENATLDDIKEIADILGVAYQVSIN